MNLTEINAQIFDQTGVEEWFGDTLEVRRAIEGGALAKTRDGWALRLPTMYGWQTVAEVCLCNHEMSHDAVIGSIKRMMKKGMLSCRFDAIAGVEIMEISRK